MGLNLFNPKWDLILEISNALLDPQQQVEWPYYTGIEDAEESQGTEAIRGTPDMYGTDWTEGTKGTPVETVKQFQKEPTPKVIRICCHSIVISLQLQLSEIQVPQFPNQVPKLIQVQIPEFVVPLSTTSCHNSIKLVFIALYSPLITFQTFTKHVGPNSDSFFLSLSELTNSLRLARYWRFQRFETAVQGLLMDLAPFIFTQATLEQAACFLAEFIPHPLSFSGLGPFLTLTSHLLSPAITPLCNSLEVSGTPAFRLYLLVLCVLECGGDYAEWINVMAQVVSLSLLDDQERDWVIKDQVLEVIHADALDNPKTCHDQEDGLDDPDRTITLGRAIRAMRSLLPVDAGDSGVIPIPTRRVQSALGLSIESKSISIPKRCKTPEPFPEVSIRGRSGSAETIPEVSIWTAMERATTRIKSNNGYKSSNSSTGTASSNSNNEQLEQELRDTCRRTCGISTIVPLSFPHDEINEILPSLVLEERGEFTTIVEEKLIGWGKESGLSYRDWSGDNQIQAGSKRGQSEREAGIALSFHVSTGSVSTENPGKLRDNEMSGRGFNGRLNGNEKGGEGFNIRSFEPVNPLPLLPPKKVGRFTKFFQKFFFT